jgi:hypothetical protein
LAVNRIDAAGAVVVAKPIATTPLFACSHYFSSAQTCPGRAKRAASGGHPKGDP